VVTDASNLFSSVAPALPAAPAVQTPEAIPLPDWMK
jgi:hypothetical protein